MPYFGLVHFLPLLDELSLIVLALLFLLSSLRGFLSLRWAGELILSVSRVKLRMNERTKQYARHLHS